MKKLAGLIVVLLIGAGAGAGGYAWWRARQAEPGTEVLTLYGNVEIRDAELAFNGEEHIAEVLVEEGDPVKAGQVVARLDTSRLQAEIANAEARVAAQTEIVRRLENGTRPQEIAQARAEVVAAEARLHKARRDLIRIRESARLAAASEEELEDAEAQVAVKAAGLDVRRAGLDLALEGPREEDVKEAKARLAATRAELALLEDRLADATLVAPAAGTIQSRILEPGEFATPTRPVLTLALRNPKWIRAFVPQPDLGKIARGTSATVTSDSFPNQTFDGWVGFISPTAEFTPKTVQTTDLRTRLVYEVRIYVRDPENQLRLGQPVTVTVQGKTASTTSAAQKPATRPAEAGG